MWYIFLKSFSLARYIEIGGGRERTDQLYYGIMSTHGEVVKERMRIIFRYDCIAELYIYEAVVMILLQYRGEKYIVDQ